MWQLANLAGASSRKREKKDGGNLRKPQASGTDGRRVSFAARFGGMAGPLKDSKGKPTRLKACIKEVGVW